MMRRLSTAVLLVALSVQAQGQDRRVNGAGTVAVVLDATEVATLQGYEGGGWKADVITEPGGKKHIGAPQVDDLVIALTLPLHPKMATWIQGVLDGKMPRQVLSLVHLDARRQAVQTLTLDNCLIVKVAFPTFDAASRESVSVGVTIRAEKMAKKVGGMEYTVADRTARNRVQGSNFRFSLAGLAGTGVVRIDPIIVSLQETSDATGERRDPAKVPATLAIAPFALTLTAPAEPWATWAEEFMVMGKCDDAHEKSGTLELLGQDLKSVEFSLAFANVGICRLRRSATSNDRAERIEVGLYCEGLSLDTSKVAPAPTGSPTGSPTPGDPSPSPTPSPMASPAGDPADQGPRDPSTFPRPENAVRTNFTSSRQKTRNEERAEYSIKEPVAQVEERYGKVIRDSGWEETSRSESGDVKQGNYFIDLRYKKDSGSAVLYLQSKGEGTSVVLMIITDTSR